MNHHQPDDLPRNEKPFRPAKAKTPPPPPSRYELAPLPGTSNLPGVLEALLKHPGRVAWELGQARAGQVLLALLLIAVAAFAIYGLVVGSFVGGSQLWTAPVKIAGGSLLSLLICLPSLYIFLCLSDGNIPLRQVAGLGLGSAALTSLLLIGFAPVAWVFSQSTNSVLFMAFLHLVFWVVAFSFGMAFLLRSSGMLSRGGSANLRLWVGIYLLVCLQMMTSLRPIIGRADTFLPEEKKFFLQHWSDTVVRSVDP